MLSHTFDEMQKAIRERVSLIEIDKENFGINILGERVTVSYKNNTIVVFDFYISNPISEDGKTRITSRFTVYLKIYEDWFNRFIGESNKVIHVDEFFRAHEGNKRKSFEEFLDEYLPVRKDMDEKSIAEEMSKYGLEGYTISFDTYNKTYNTRWRN